MRSEQTIPQLQWKSITSAKWNIGGQFLVQILNVGGTIILSRWLPPAAVGLLLMLSLISNFVAIILNHAIGSAIIQSGSLNNKDLSSIFWLNILLAAVFHILLLAASPLISGFYREDALLRYLPYFGLIFFFYALGCVSQALLVKKHMFKQVVVGNLTGIIISFAVAIFMLWRGFGVESLLAQLLLNTFISSLYFFIIEKWKPALHLSILSLRKVQRFIAHLSFNSGLEYFVFNLDNFLVGRYLGNSALGLYGRARQWVFLPVQNIAFAISRSYFPSFAQLKGNTPALQEMYLFSFRFTFYLTSIAITYMIVSAEDLVMVFLGSHWMEIVPLFIWFSLTGIIGTINGFNDSFITSQGQTGLLLRTGIFEKVLTIAGLLLALRFGLQGLVFARLVTAMMVVIPKTNALLIVSELSLKKWFRSLLPTILICLCLLATGLISEALMNSMKGIPRLLCVSLLFLVLTGFLSRIFKEDSYQYIVDILRRKNLQPPKENAL
ncbi:MAG: lipopolysaccharide biosynthesis protein [Chitinophagaceae bacterium]|nr:MAG: lipopolysaccharide biosynthesis protein [Chitinophagaceae bacterium]